jgi:hypothetical protein
MSYYRLFYGGTELGDEVILPLGEWQKTARTTSSDQPQAILPLDDEPISLVLYPSFRLRKKCEDVWAFERWLFDLTGWADGGRRELQIFRDDLQPVADYGFCKLLSLARPEPTGPQDGRGSDQVVLTFQSDTPPEFFNL